VTRAALALPFLLLGGACATRPPPVATEMPLVVGTGDVHRDPAKRAANAEEPVPPGGSLPEGSPIGARAPGFALAGETPAGRAVLLFGRVTVLHFWATWCEPCKKTFPELDAIYRRHKDRGFSVLALSVDDESEQIGEFAKVYGASFPVGFDAGHTVTQAYRPISLPMTYVIDRGGVVQFVHAGFHDGEEAEIEREVTSLL
jgi:thiol-disulfide isomerase/thioredoxin